VVAVVVLGSLMWEAFFGRAFGGGEGEDTSDGSVCSVGESEPFMESSKVKFERSGVARESPKSTKVRAQPRGE